MNELIKITEHKGNSVVSARDLHKFLESKSDFSTWIKKRIARYGFVENQDYSCFHQKMEANNAILTEYALTLDTAKELAMVEGNAKGKEARQYFIACEKKLKEVVPVKSQIDLIVESALALREQEQRLAKVEDHVKLLEAKITTTPNFFTVAGFANLNGYQASLQICTRIGQLAKRLCTNMNIETGTIPDPRWGKVRTYPMDILKQVFEEQFTKAI